MYDTSHSALSPSWACFLYDLKKGLFESIFLPLDLEMFILSFKIAFGKNLLMQKDHFLTSI
jgi:hypothetical protein